MWCSVTVYLVYGVELGCHVCVTVYSMVLSYGMLGWVTEWSVASRDVVVSYGMWCWVTVYVLSYGMWY